MVPLKSCIAKKKRNLLGNEDKDSSDDEARRAKGVFFAFVLIREHERILGDHPCVSSGPPISLDWDVDTEYMYSLDMYEQRRQVRRSRGEFLVPESVRIEWLLQAGYTANALYEVSQKVMEDRRRRFVSATNTQLLIRVKADDFAENFKRTIDWVTGKRDADSLEKSNNVENDLDEIQGEDDVSSKVSTKPTPVRSASSSNKSGNSSRKQMLRRRPSSAFL